MLKSIPKTVLVVKNRAMGDAIMGLGTIQYLKSLYPDSKIIYATPRWVAPLFEDCEHACDQVLPLELKTFKDYLALYETCLNLKIDVILELFQSGRTARFFKVFSALTGIPYFFHNHHTKEGPVYDQGIIKSNIQRDLDGAWSFLGTSLKPPSYLSFCPQMYPKELKNPLHRKRIILGIVATRKTKQWPLTSFAKLIEMIRADSLETEILIPLSSSSADLELETELKKELASLENIVFLRESLRELPKFLYKGSFYIGNDTGLKHLCVALGIPSLTLFGPEPPLEWHPYNTQNHPYLFKEPLECRTKTAHYCGLSECESMICLNEFSAEEVFKVAKSHFQS